MIHHWGSGDMTRSGHVTLRKVKTGWRVRCSGTARCGWYANYAFESTARWAAMAHGAAHAFGWDATPSVGYAALLYPGADGRLRVLDEGIIAAAPWPQPSLSGTGAILPLFVCEEERRPPRNPAKMPGGVRPDPGNRGKIAPVPGEEER